jgi:isoleucyl-tRNA synthetase
MAKKKATLPESKTPEATTGKVDAVKIEGTLAPKPTAPVTSSVVGLLAGLQGKKSKAKTPVMDLVEQTKGEVAKLRELHSALEAAKVAYTDAAEKLIASVQPKYREYVRNIAYVSSVHVSDGQADLLVSWKDAYSAIPLDIKAEIETVVGAEKFKEFFAITAKIEATTADETVIKQVVELLQKSGLMGHFEVEGFIKPTTRFTQERFKAFTADQNGQLDPLVKQYKPSVRIR